MPIDELMVKLLCMRGFPSPSVFPDRFARLVAEVDNDSLRHFGILAQDTFNVLWREVLFRAEWRLELLKETDLVVRKLVSDFQAR